MYLHDAICQRYWLYKLSFPGKPPGPNVAKRDDHRATSPRCDPVMVPDCLGVFLWFSVFVWFWGVFLVFGFCLVFGFFFWFLFGGFKRDHVF